MSVPYPQEFRDDVVRVARNRGPGQKLAVIAKDFGISESCLTSWMRQSDAEEGARPDLMHGCAAGSVRSF